MKLLILTLFLLNASALHADVLIYEIYTINDDSKELLNEGVKTYDFKDISAGHWRRSIDLTDDFYIGGSIYREKEVTGFGLWIGITTEWYEFWVNEGFSWEWFTKDSNGVFVKLQESGKLKVIMETIDNNEEIKKIEFLSDVTMRLNDSWIPFATENTHLVVIKKGSVLNLEHSPNNALNSDAAKD